MPGPRDCRSDTVTPPSQVVVVGASIGGITAAETLRREGFDGEIVVVGDEPHRPYLRPPLSKQILLGEWEPEQAFIQTVAKTDELDIDLRTSCVALDLDVAGRVVQTSQGDLPYDELIIATGSEPRRHPRLPSALTLRTMDDALNLRDGLQSAHRVGVIGVGVLGSEIASAARKYGAEALMIGRSASLTFGGVGALLSSRLIRLHEDNGVGLALCSEVVRAAPTGSGTSLELADGRTELVDLLVSMIGSTPRTGWLHSSTLTIADGVVCDSFGGAAPGVSAVGDVAAWKDPFTGRHARVEHQSNAIEQAIAVALRIVHGELGSQPVPFFWSEIHGVRINAFGWFDPARSLVAAEGESTDDAAVIFSRDDTNQIRGVVGWNAHPREFRTARGTVLSQPVLTPSR